MFRDPLGAPGGGSERARPAFGRAGAAPAATLPVADPLRGVVMSGPSLVTVILGLGLDGAAALPGPRGIQGTEWAYVGLLLLIGVERLVELGISRRHARAAMARGGREFGRGHFPALALLHALFLPACALEVIWLERPLIPGLAAVMLAAVLAAQALRYWAVVSLGTRWNVRIIAVPGEPRVERGPYRYVRHPNYLAVALEGAALPLIHSAWIVAVAFSVANAWLLLRVRIPAEERALAGCAPAGNVQPFDGRKPRWDSRSN